MIFPPTFGPIPRPKPVCPVCLNHGAWRETKPFKWMSEPYMEPAPCPRCGKYGRRPEFAGRAQVP